MSISPWIGWSVTSLLSMWISGKSSDNSSSSDSEPDKLSVTETTIGTPIPVVIGRALLKQPLTTFYGDFRADKYTETYASHASFSAWPLVLTLIANYIAAPATGHQVTPAAVQGTVTTGQGAGGNVTGAATGATTKDDAVGPLLQSLFMWLLMWLINGRNLKTTIQKGFKYYLGYQLVFCMSGNKGRVRSIYLNKKKVWSGDENQEKYNKNPPSVLSIPVDDENLFGGVDESGGFVGNMHVYLGGDNQLPDQWMIDRMSVSTVDESIRGLTPAYRDYVTMVVPTAYVGKSATIPETWLEYQFQPDNLGLGGIDEDANPAEAIYEILTNKVWGLCEDPGRLDIESLNKIGKTLADEKIGVTITISSKTQAKKILDDLCDHLNMVKYINPDNGKLCFKLIRDDYDPAAVPLLNDSNCSKVTYTRLTWQNVSGETCVVYTNRELLYEQISLYKSDMAVITIKEGDKNTQTVQYPYFTTTDNAMWAANRDGRQKGYPLASCTITGDRNLYGITLGQVVRLDWPPYGISNMLLRVTDVDMGNFEEGEITLECIEDIFSLDKTTFGNSDSTDWKPPVDYPSGVQSFRYLELPWELSRSPDGYVYALAVKPDLKTGQWTILRKKTPDDNWQTTNTMTQWTTAGILSNDYPDNTAVEDLDGFEMVEINGIHDTKVRADVSGSGTDISSARKGTKLIAIGDEILGWGAIEALPGGHWKVKNIIRGVYDTIPQYHNSGEIIYFLESGMYSNVTTGAPVTPNGYTATEQYNIITTAGTTTETPDPNKVKTITTTRRQERPNPPGRIRLYDGFYRSENRYLSRAIGDLTFTWCPRNKVIALGLVSQDDTQDYFAGSAFIPPTGLEYVLRVYVDSTLVDTIKTADTTHTFKWSDRYNYDSDLSKNFTVEIGCEVDGLECEQFHSRQVAWNMPQALTGVEAEDDVMAMVGIWSITDKEVVIPQSPYCSETAIEYKDYPLFIGGTKSATKVGNSIICWDGSYLIPNGKLYHLKNSLDFESFDMEPGYTFKYWLNETGNGGSTIYKWDGSKLVSVS